MRRPIQCLQRSSTRMTGASALILTLLVLASTGAGAQYAPTASHEQVDLGKLVCKDAHFPKEEVASGGEGWVEFRVKVQADGTLTDVERVTSTAGDRFVEGALRNLSKCRFSQPRQENGQPAVMANVYTRFSFMQSPSRPGQGVKEKTELSRQLLAQGRLDEASANLDTAEQAANRVSELNDIILLRSALMGLRGRDDIALRYIQQIPVAEKDLGDEERARLLRIRLGLELKLGLLASADLSGRKLAKAAPQADDAAMLASLEKLRQLGASGQPMAVKGRVPAECRPVICDPARPTWEYVPTHRTLSLADPTGRLDTVTFRCARKTFATPATTGTTWTLPASFGTCAVEVTGEPGASFTLIDETVAG